MDNQWNGTQADSCAGTVFGLPYMRTGMFDQRYLISTIQKRALSGTIKRSPGNIRKIRNSTHTWPACRLTCGPGCVLELCLF